MKFCINCGKKIPKKNKFCPYCGANQQSNQSYNVTNKLNKAHHVRDYVIPIIVIFLVVILGVAAVHNYNAQRTIPSTFDHHTYEFMHGVNISTNPHEIEYNKGNSVKYYKVTNVAVFDHGDSIKLYLKGKSPGADFSMIEIINHGQKYFWQIGNTSNFHKR